MAHVVSGQLGGKHGNSESGHDGGDQSPRKPKRQKPNVSNPSKSNSAAAASGSSAKDGSAVGAGEASNPAGGPDEDVSGGSAGHGSPAAATQGLDRQALLARIRDTTTRVNGLTSNNRPCICPANCAGTGHRGKQAAKRFQGKTVPPKNRSQEPKPGSTDIPPLNPTPEEGHIDATRSIARVLAKAEVQKDVHLPRFGGVSGTRARLRVTLEVHDDPYGYRSRLGYYAQMFLTPDSDPRERSAGYISSWRISKPNAGQQLVDPTVWVEEWLRRPIPEGEDNESICTGILMEPLQRLYDQNGNTRENLRCDGNALKALYNDHNGHEIVFIPMILIYHELPCNDDLCAVWYHAYPRREGEPEDGPLRRMQETLERHYTRYGWELYEGTPGQNPIMGRLSLINADGDNGGSLQPISRDQPPAEPGPSAQSPAQRRSAGSGASAAQLSSSPPTPAVPTSSSYRESSSVNGRYAGSASSDPFVDTP
ncbi:hypothetical protein VPNG_06784 [Cytospora leucostoma]|uniref:Uncharacterized protein n=1 Tax=Cytospora leucostoma TaxID=1230097 RepID=A0A423WVW8_9PEZI|nr:hypothetical protein VPNG_06784 [Cytospora leucostoma]